MDAPRLWVRCGVAGVAAVVCYIVAITVPWPETQLGSTTALLLASAWPTLSIVYVFGLYHFIAAERDSASNRLAFVFAVAAFAMLLAMIVVQLAVGASIGEITAGLGQPAAGALRRGLRMIDMGLDGAVGGAGCRADRTERVDLPLATG